MRTRTTWLTVAGSLLVVLAVMVWVTATLSSLDAERIQAEREGVLEEQARLALWRVDSAMTPILAREVALLGAPPSPDTPPPIGASPRDASSSDAWPSDALVDSEPRVVMRFELGPAGLRARTQATPEQIAWLAGALSVEAIFAQLEAPPEPAVAAKTDSQAENAADTPYAYKTQTLRNNDEWSRRKASAEDNFAAYGKLATIGPNGSSGEREPARRGLAPAEAREPHTLVRALWVAGELFVVRGVGAGPSRRVQGTWLDWPALRALVLEEVTDLFPAATLVPVLDGDQVRPERMLATLPAQLEPGASIAPPATWSPLRASLIAAWVIVLGAFAALLALVRASTALSERRATFVSTVTHELRTPLTTFRMYTEMLGEGMVEHKRERYVAILRREADRLSGLVENVLAYAQLESDRAPSKREPMSTGLLVDRVLDRLRERCEAADMELELELRGEDRDIRLLVDPAAVEQILFNLVDNASKYASTGEDPRICLRLEVGARAVELHVRDFGPGIAAQDARQIFEPFTKARADAAGTKPGVGLGLALSRRLARQMGGELRVIAARPGADFVLTLPRG